MSRLSIVVSLVLVSLLAAGSSVGAANKVLKLGSIATTSGPNASMGREGLAGLEYGVKKINAAGGVKIGADTYSLELLNLDDESKAEKAVANAERLLTSEKVPVIFGPPASTTVLALLPTAEKNKTLVMTYIAASPAIIKSEFSYSFRTSLDSLQAVNPSLEFLVKERHAKTIAYLGRNDDWGRSAGKAVVAKAQQLGAKVVVDEYFDPGTADFYGLLTKVKEANPDAVLFSTIIEDGVPLIKQYRELRIKADPLNLGVIWASPHFLSAAGKAAEGAYVATAAQTSDTPAIKDFNREFQAATGTQSQSFDKTGYDTLMIVLAAMKKAGTTDPTKVRDVLRTFEYQGVLQTYRFTGTGQSEIVVNINQIKNGSMTVIKSLRTK